MTVNPASSQHSSDEGRDFTSDGAEIADDVDVVLDGLVRLVLAKGELETTAEGLLPTLLDYVSRHVQRDAILQRYLRAYRSASSQEARCAYFVALSNRALALLFDAEQFVQHLRAASELDILFVRNDSKSMAEHFFLEEEERSSTPSVVITSRRVAQAYYSNNTEDWNELGSLGAQSPSTSPNLFSWPHLLSVANVVYTDTATEMKGKKRARVVDENTDPRPAKRLKGEQSKDVPPAPAHPTPPSEKAEEQLASCAASMLSRPGPVAHVAALLVQDEDVMLRWYDRTGIIKVAAINVVQDLGRFLVLLLCLQRFDLEEWGLVPELDIKAAAAHLGGSEQPQTSTLIKYESCTADLGRLRKPFVLGLDEKGTRVANVDHLSPSPRFAGSLKPDWYEPGEDMECIVKISWVDAARTPEPKLVATVRDRITTEQDEERVGRHLPWIVDYKNHSIPTGLVRDLFGVRRKTRMLNGKRVSVPGSQVLRSLVAEKLHSAEDLENEDDFLKAFLGMIGAIFGCWKRGVHYKDASIGNTMYRTVNGKLCGVPNDFDLASEAHEPDEGLDNTGTPPFTALAVLNVYSKPVLRCLAHDLEASVWVMDWACHYPPGDKLPVKSVVWIDCKDECCRDYKMLWQEGHRFGAVPREGWSTLARITAGIHEDCRVLREEEPLADDSTLGQWTWFANRVVLHTVLEARRRGAEGDSLWEIVEQFVGRWRDTGVRMPDDNELSVYEI